MTLPSVADLAQILARSELLSSAQQQELAGLQVAFAEPRALIGELVRRDWLTPLQANYLLQGRGHELTLGPYLLLERLGAGGTGEVFKARHRLMRRLVAVKVIRPEQLASEEARRRFRREVQAAGQLQHPHLVLTHDAFESDGCSVLVMELLEGEDLGRLVRRGGPLPVAQACAYVRQAALGLQHAHAGGLVHRDVKPSNLVVARVPGSAAGVVKVLDVGLARSLAGVGGERALTELTQAGALMGTPDYLAPEQALDPRAADVRSDVYSLGCTFYFLLAGRPPFPEGSLTQKLLWHQGAEPTAVESLRPEVPAAVAGVLRRMLAKRPGERYQTLAEVAAALDPFAEQAPEAVPAAVPGLPEGERPLGHERGWTLTVDPSVIQNPLPPLPGQAGAGERGGATLAPSWPQSDSGPPPVPDSWPGAARSPAGPPLPGRVSWGLLGLVVVLLLGVGGAAFYAGFAFQPKQEERAPPRAQEPGEKPGEQPVFKKKVPPPAKYAKDVTNSIGMKLVLIPAGKFRMGSPKSEAGHIDTEEKHEVQITRRYYLGKYEVTQGQWENVMGSNPSIFSATGDGSDAVAGMDTRNFPVENIRWKDAVEFCKRLTALPKEKAAGRVYRLPTEAEWEYACRAGKTTPFHFGDRLSTDQANYHPTKGEDRKGRERPTPVGSFPANAWRLHDMHGNVSEWCQDWYGPYSELEETDPLRVDKGSVDARVLRGGSWGRSPYGCRSASRAWGAPDGRNGHCGCRVVLCLD